MVAKKHDMPVVTDTALLGEQGMVAVQKLAPQLGFLFRDTTKSDYGIDAFVELIEATSDPTVSYATGRLLAVQVKCGETVAREHSDSYRLYCTPANVNYWKRHSLPVVVIYCDPQTGACFWVQVADHHLRFARVNWVLTIPKANKLEDAKAALTRLCELKSPAIITRLPDEFLFTFDEGLGVLNYSDEELGLMCGEIVGCARRGGNPTITIEVTTQALVTAKLDDLDTKPTLTLEERKDRIGYDEIERRHEQKKADIASCVLMLLTNQQVAEPYFGGQDHESQGRALRRLFSRYTNNQPARVGVLSVDIFPSQSCTEPCIKVLLDQGEVDELQKHPEISDLNTQMVSWWGFIAADLPHKVLVEKFLPELVYVLQIYAKRSHKTAAEFLQEIAVPLQAWPIGRS